MAGLSETERAEVWVEIEEAFEQFETTGGFTGPCEMLVGVGTN